VCLLNETGQLHATATLPGTREAITEFATTRLLPTDHVALEASFNTWAIVPLLLPFVAHLVVSNPLQTKAIAQAKIKTDKVDASVLAQSLRCGYLPVVWVPDEQTLRLRRLTHRRAALVADRTRLKNRIHALLAHALMRPPLNDLFSPPGREWLQKLPLPEEERQQLDSDPRLLDAVEAEIEQLDRCLVKHAYPDPQVRLLMTLPGVDYTFAVALRAALGDLSRFRDGDHAASYLGLIPSTRQSGRHCYHGSITKQGSGHVRWLLIQAAQHLDKHPGPLGVFFRRLAQKKNRNVAVVATARKLVTIAFLMLKHNEPYRYSPPLPTQNKLRRLRVKASGQKRRSGPKKGAAPAAHRGTGRYTRLVPALGEVYASEELPHAKKVSELSLAERRMLQEKGVMAFVEQIQTAQRVERRRKTPSTTNHETANPIRSNA
jgi:transposase